METRCSVASMFTDFLFTFAALHVTSLSLFACVCGSDQDQYQDQSTLESDMGHSKRTTQTATHSQPKELSIMA